MPVFANAFDTTAMSGHQAAANKLRTALQDSYHRGQMLREEQLPGCWLVDNNYTPEANPVPAFAHPIDFEGYKHEPKEAHLMAVDMRGFTTFDPNQGERRVRLESEYNLMKARLLLNRVWLDEEPDILFRLSWVPLTLFTEWVAQAVGRKAILDPKQQLTMAIWAGYYYYGLFKTEAEPSEMEKVRIVDILKKALLADASHILSVIEGQTYPTSIIDFCERAEAIVGNVRLRELNFATLYHLLSGTWFGPNAKETLTVALEHPPTWIAICLSAFGERTYKKSSIARLTELNRYREAGRQFSLAASRLLNYS